MYCIEKPSKKPIAFTEFNLFIDDVSDMNELEFWEDKLDSLEQDYVTVFRKDEKGKVLYSIFSNTYNSESKFR